MLESVIEIIQNNLHLAPYLICFVLLLAGLNLPISEDLMIFVTACLAYEHPEYLYKLIIGLFLGIYGSDIISFSIGKLLGPAIWKIKFLSSSLKKEKVDKVGSYYFKYGIFVLLIGRFIPFGVRNLLFMSAGFVKIPWLKFLSWDFCAACLTTSVYFSLYYTYGSKVIQTIKEGNLILFIVFICLCIGFLGYKKIKKSRELKKSKKDLNT